MLITAKKNIVKNTDKKSVYALPYEILKGIFPSLVYKVYGEVWHRKYIGHRKNEATGKTETYASGEWLPDASGRSFSDPETALTYAKGHYSKGHYRIVKYIPELEYGKHPNVIGEC